MNKTKTYVFNYLNNLIIKFKQFSNANSPNLYVYYVIETRVSGLG